MTTYIFQTTNISEYEYYDFTSGDAYYSTNYYTDTIQVSILGDETPAFTVEDGELTHSAVIWEDHFFSYDYPYIGGLRQLTWDGGVTYFFIAGDYYSGYYFDSYSVSEVEMYVAFGGDPLPTFDHLPEDEQYGAFWDFLNSGTVTSAEDVYPNGTQIAFKDIPGVVISQDDTVLGTDDADQSATGAGRDFFIEWDGSKGADVLDGGEGFDTVDYNGGQNAKRSFVVVDLNNSDRNAGAATGDTLIDIEAVWGTSEDDALYGTAGTNRLNGEGGNDVLVGRGGDDKLLGKSGDDALRGGAGADLINGGKGWDKATYVDATTGVLVDMQDATISTGDAAGDTFTDVEVISATAMDDMLRGDGGDNRFKAGDGDDALRGRAGDDVLFGEGGDDRLNGDAGNDQLLGGAGADSFMFNGGHDVVHDLTDQDFLFISNRFSTGSTLTNAEIRAAASVEDGALTLDFTPQHSLTLLGINSVSEILDQVIGY